MRPPRLLLRRRSRPLPATALALALLLLVGGSSVEVLWAREEPPAAPADGLAWASDPAPEGGCPCLCACACEAVHVVLPTPQGLAPGRLAPAFGADPITVAPAGRSADAPFRPPRPLA